MICEGGDGSEDENKNYIVNLQNDDNTKKLETWIGMVSKF